MRKSNRTKKRQDRRRRRDPAARRRLLWSVAGVVLLVMVIGGLTPDSSHSLDSIGARGELVIITRNAPTTYFESRDGLAGMEHDMAQSFAKFLGVEARFVVKNSVNEVISALHAGEGDLAAAGLTYTAGRANSFLFGPTYQDVQQEVVCLRGAKRPRKPAQLKNFKVMVPANSSQEEQLTALKRKHAELSWDVTYKWDEERLMEMVAEGELDCTVVDSNTMSINRRYFPELIVAFSLNTPEKLAWLMPDDAEELHYVLGLWFNSFKSNGKLAYLEQRYYGHIDMFDYVDTRTFSNRVVRDLPKFKPLFIEAEQKYKIPWTLLAAQAYQESHWKVKAESPTGVRGIMMLTLATASDLGIKNRLDPKQSVMGGAKYLRQLYRRLPESIKEPDRMWFALAAYNVGLGHVYDARKLARRRGLDPNLWSDLSKVLPLLTQKKYYSQLKHGYARGREPVIYVNNIRDYHDILERHIQVQAAKN